MSSLLQTLVEGFDDNSINTGIWTATNSVVEQNQRLEIASSTSGALTSSLVSNTTYQLDGSYARVQLVGGILNLANVNYYVLSLDFDSNNGMQIYILSNSVKYNIRTLGTDHLSSEAYNTTNHKYFRIIDKGDGYYSMERSADSVSWVFVTRQSKDTFIGDVTVTIKVATTGSQATPSTMLIDNLNVDYSPQVSDTTSLSDTLRGYSDTVASRDQSFTMLESLVGVSETVTVSENTTLSVGFGFPQVTVSDSATVAETVQLDMPIAINRSDTASVSEIVSATLVDTVAIQDATTVTEAVTVRGELNIAVSDNSTVGESDGLLTSISTAVSESLTVTENVQRLLSSLTTVSDNSSVADVPNIALVHTINVSDTAGHSESVTAVPAYDVASADSAALSESFKTEVSSFGNVSDSTTLSEAWQLVLESLVTKSDLATLSESLQIVRALDVNVSNTVTVAETRTVDVPLTVNKTEAVTVAETTALSIISTGTFGKLTNGTTSSASSVDKMFVSTATPPSSGTVVKGTVRIWLSATGSTKTKFVIYADSSGTAGALLATSDEVTISNTTEQAIDYTFSGAQQITITSGTPYWIGPVWQDPGTPSVTVSRDNTASMRIEQILTYPTMPDPFGTPSATNSGPIDAYVTYNTLSTNLAINVYEQPILDEAVQVDVAVGMNRSDATTVSESLNRVLVSTVSATDAAAGAESLQGVLESFVNRSDTVTLTEASSVVVAMLLIAAAETVTVSESRQLVEAYDVTKSDTATVTDAVTLVRSLAIVITENRLTDESGNFILDENGNFILTEGTAERATVTDSVNLVLESNRQVMDTATLTEAVTVFQTNLVITVTQAMTVSEAISRDLSVQATNLTDTLSVSDQPQVRLESAITVSDQSSLSESLQRLLTAFATITDTATLVEAGQRLVESSTLVTDSVTLSESQTVLLPVLNVAVTDSATVSELLVVVVVQQGAVNVFDSIVLTDTPSLLLPELNAGVADTVTVSENRAIALTVPTPLFTDTATVTDVVSIGITVLSNTSDTVTVGETGTTILMSDLSRSESVSLGESRIVDIPVSVQVLDTATLQDSLTAFTPFLAITVTDTTTISEARSLLVMTDGSIVLTEPVTVADQPVVLVPELYLASSQSITVTENLSRLVESNVQKTETVVATDTGTIFLPTLPITVVDSVSLAEAIAFYLLNLSVVVAQAVTVNESPRMRVPPLREAASDSVNTLHTGDPSQIPFTPATSSDDSTGALHTGDPSGQPGVPTVYNSDMVSALKG